MKEKFIDIKKAVGHKVDNFLRNVLDAPPTFDEVLSNFPHDKKCTRSRELIPREGNRQIIPFDNTGLSQHPHAIIVKVQFLECPECHVSKRYSG
jgi:hypothetical protein